MYRAWRKMCLLAALALLTACVDKETPAAPDQVSESAQAKVSWPEDNWEVSTPEAEGVDAAVLDAIASDFKAGKYGLVDKFIVIRHGRIIADHTFDNDYDAIVAEAGYEIWDSQYSYDNTRWHPFYQDTDLHTLQSTTKSVISAVLGIAIDEGLIESVNAPATPFFSDYEHDLSDPRKAAITVKSLLTMRAGIEWRLPGQGGYDDDSHPTTVMENSDAWIQYVLDKPMASDPGTVWEYNDGASVLLGKIVTQATGRRADEYARDKLFEPLGMEDYYWKITPDGEVDSEGGLYLNAYDLARFAYLFLREGMWKDQRILSSKWIQDSVKPYVDDVRPEDDTMNWGYGYQWWVTEYEGDQTAVFSTAGYGGQYAMVSPEHDIVVVLNGWNIHSFLGATWNILTDRVLPAVR